MSWHEFWVISYLFSPLLIGLTVHGFSIKYRWFSSLVRPIDGGKTFRGKRIFGENKTYRGIVMTGLGTALGFTLQAVVFHRWETFQKLELLDYSGAGIVFLGLLTGAVAMLGELPNSFIKRQIDIAPGATTGGVLNLLFYILDQIDYLPGVWIVFSFFTNVTLQRVIFSAVFLFITHQIISLLGFWLGMRKTAR